MESFFDFIFSNIFLVVFVIVSLLGLLNKSKPDQKGQQKEVNTEQQQRPRTNEPMRRMREMIETLEQEFNPVQEEIKKVREEKIKQQAEINTEIKQPSSYLEERQLQFERLQSRYASQSNIEESRTTLNTTNILREQSNVQEMEKVDLSNKLTREGLIESVMMAEVLGPPRALKPYQSIVNQRRLTK